ncbi:MAG TPA: hypothetical protein VNL98_04815 [Gemmatimonadales bacterium]|nr:hypothetical protein [Gemmatimonadales bacterium]
MIRKAVERVYDVVAANFNAEFATLAAAASVPAVTADFFKRLAAERFRLRTNAGLGIYQDGGRSQSSEGGAPGSRLRMPGSWIVIVLDWEIAGDNEDTVALQTEIAVDAALRCVDRLVAFDATSGVGGAATERGSFTWQIERTPKSKEGALPRERAIMRFPILARDTGLQ